MGRPLLYWSVPSQHRRRIVNAVHHAIDRCHNPSNPKWHRYGGRGMSVLPAWRKFPWEFAAYLCTLIGWDDPSLVLDRIDNNAGYFPENLRWASYSESARNTCRRCVDGVGTIGKCWQCRKKFVRNREHARFCSPRCRGVFAARRRWRTNNGGTETKTAHRIS